jgi:5-methylcytosine-specific restriction endonuclease McrA
MTRRNPDRYTVQDWKFAGPTVGAIIANRWLVYTECDLCELRAVTLAKAGAGRPETHRPRARLQLRPVGPRHDLPPDGLPGPGHLLGAAAWGERGCGDDVRGWICSRLTKRYCLTLRRTAMTEQTCKDCNERLPLTREFFGQYKNVGRGGVTIGFRSSCRKCMAARSARHSMANPEQKAERAKRRAEQAGPARSREMATHAVRLRGPLGDTCRYCDEALNGGGEVDHLTPVARGGTNRISNLTLACMPCNRAKLAKTLDEYLAWRAERGLAVRQVDVPGECPDSPKSDQQRRSYD